MIGFFKDNGAIWYSKVDFPSLEQWAITEMEETWGMSANPDNNGKVFLRRSAVAFGKLPAVLRIYSALLIS